jgi:hypothetical protein
MEHDLYHLPNIPTFYKHIHADMMAHVNVLDFAKAALVTVSNYSPEVCKCKEKSLLCTNSEQIQKLILRVNNKCKPAAQGCSCNDIKFGEVNV